MTGKEIVLKWLGPAVTTYDYPAVQKEMNVLIDAIDATIATLTAERNELDLALTETMRERDGLEAATRRVVEAAAHALVEISAPGFGPDGYAQAVAVKAELVSALADPVIVALRGELWHSR